MYSILGLLILLLDIIAIVEIVKSGLEPVMKLVWVLIVLALPVVGMILWYVLGSKKVPA